MARWEEDNKVNFMKQYLVRKGFPGRLTDFLKDSFDFFEISFVPLQRSFRDHLKNVQVAMIWINIYRGNKPWKWENLPITTKK